MILGHWLLTIGQKPTAKSQKPIAFVRKYGRCHASPNSGYPEAALAGILNCRFGGPHYYFGQLFDKPFIGTNDRPLTTDDMKKAVRINRTAEVLMIVLVAALSLFTCSWLLPA
jgi:adenosylcobinamide-phosphate synthase